MTRTLFSLLALLLVAASCAMVPPELTAATELKRQATDNMVKNQATMIGRYDELLAEAYEAQMAEHLQVVLSTEAIDSPVKITALVNELNAQRKEWQGRLRQLREQFLADPNIPVVRELDAATSRYIRFLSETQGNLQDLLTTFKGKSPS